MHVPHDMSMVSVEHTCTASAGTALGYRRRSDSGHHGRPSGAGCTRHGRLGQPSRNMSQPCRNMWHGDVEAEILGGMPEIMFDGDEWLRCREAHEQKTPKPRAPATLNPIYPLNTPGRTPNVQP